MFFKKNNKDEKENTPIAETAPVEVVDEDILPLVITKNVIMGAGITSAIDMPQGPPLDAIHKAHENTDLVCFVEQKNKNTDNPDLIDLYPIGTICEIKNVINTERNSTRVVVEGVSRCSLQAITEKKPVYMAKVERLSYEQDSPQRIKVLYRILIDKYIKFMKLVGKAEDYLYSMLDDKTVDDGIDYIMSNVPTSYKDFYEVLEQTDVEQRVTKAISIISEIYNYSKLEVDLENDLATNLTEEQKNHYLREKKELINRELGFNDDDVVEEYKEKLIQLELDEETTEHIEKEISRLEICQMGSQEAAVIQTYLDCIFDMPWKESTVDNYDIHQARTVLDEDHYGLEKVKDRIEEYLSVIKLTDSIKGSILCLVGPPGVGKTSIAKSIARATGRKFVRVSLGGVRDESEVRGHRKTYVGAMPGRIANGLRQAKSNNPVFLLDEIDKLGSDYRGDPSSALLEVLDPEQNSTFVDTFLEVPFDLSNVMFITTANTTSTIPAPLLDRMEVIELTGYSSEEKRHIAADHLVKKQMENNGVTNEDITISDEVIDKLINSYTRESGVRQLERQIGSLCRKAAKAKVKEEPFEVTVENLHDILGHEVHTYEVFKDESLVGVVNGLAWTSVGGETLQLEAVVQKGSGKLELTGSLGDVMKESAKIAVGYLRANGARYGINDEVWEKNDIHIHAPEGAVPKDGPSAGVTMTTVLISAITSTPVSQLLAMTGEISLTGRVLAIGGLKEKLLAAVRANVNRVIIPKENEKDLDEVDPVVKEKLSISFASNITDVYDFAFPERPRLS